MKLFLLLVVSDKVYVFCKICVLTLIKLILQLILEDKAKDIEEHEFNVEKIFDTDKNINDIIMISDESPYIFY